MKNLRILLIATCATVISMGCGDVQTSNGNQPDTSESATLANAVANLEIDGMACEVMCGGKIKETLAGMTGVVSCDLDFDKKLATVKFDNNSTSKNDMISVIQELNEGQFKVLSSDEKTLNNSEDEEVFNSNSSEQSVEVISAGNFKFPNILDALTEIL